MTMQSLEKKEENKKKEALDARDKAMTTWSKAGKSTDRDSDSDDESECGKPVARRGKKRRSTSDPFQYLAEKTAKETDMRRVRRKEARTTNAGRAAEAVVRPSTGTN